MKEFTVAELCDLKVRALTMSNAPQHKNTLLSIVATRVAMDLDHMARIIQSPAIEVAKVWVQVSTKKLKKRKRTD